MEEGGNKEGSGGGARPPHRGKVSAKAHSHGMFNQPLLNVNDLCTSILQCRNFFFLCQLCFQAREILREQEQRATTGFVRPPVIPPQVPITRRAVGKLSFDFFFFFLRAPPSFHSCLALLTPHILSALSFAASLLLWIVGVANTEEEEDSDKETLNVGLRRFAGRDALPARSISPPRSRQWR